MATKAQAPTTPNPQMANFPDGTKSSVATEAAFYSIDDDADTATMRHFENAVASLSRLGINHSVDRRSGGRPRLVRVHLRSLT